MTTVETRTALAWPLARHLAVEAEVLAAWHDGHRTGYLAACADIAARHVDLDTATWQDIGRRTHVQWIAEHLREMEEHAERARDVMAGHANRMRAHDTAALARAGVAPGPGRPNPGRAT